MIWMHSNSIDDRVTRLLAKERASRVVVLAMQSSSHPDRCHLVHLVHLVHRLRRHWS